GRHHRRRRGADEGGPGGRVQSWVHSILRPGRCHPSTAEPAMSSHSLLGAFAAALLVHAPSPRAGVIVVDQAGGGDFTNLPAAIAAAVAGDVLLVRAGAYGYAGPISITGTLT